MVAALIAVTLLNQGQTVTIAPGTMRAKDLVAEFARQSGTDLACEAMLANEPIVVSIEKKQIAECMTKLAEVVGGEWRETGDQKRLGRSSTMTQKFEREEKEFYRALIGRSLSSWMKDVEAQPPMNDATADRIVHQTGMQGGNRETQQAEFNYFGYAHPAAKASARSLDAIGTKALIDLEVGSRIVFSTKPNAMQRGMPPKARAAIDSMLKECRFLFDARNNADPNRPRTTFGGLAAIGRGDLHTYYKTLVSIRRASLGSIAYKLTSVDEKGGLIALNSGTIPNSSLVYGSAVSHKGKPLKIDDSTKLFGRVLSDLGVGSAMGTQIKLPNGRAIGISYSVSFSEQDGLATDFGLGPILQDPVKNDPVGMAFGRLALQIATERKASIIATISDSAVVASAIALQMGTISTDEDLVEWLEQKQVPEANRVPYVASDRSNDWMSIRPRFLASSLANRFNREAAKELIATIKANGAIGLEDAIRYVQRTPRVPTFNSLDRLIISHAVKEVDRHSIEYILLTPIEILGQLGPQGRKNLMQASSRIGQLPASIRDNMLSWVFGVDDLRLDDGVMFGGSALGNEPTEAFPNGLDPNTPVTLEVVPHPAVIAKSERGDVFSLSIYDLAFHESMAGQTSVMGGGPVRKYASFRLATETNYTLGLVLPSNKKISKSVRETTILPFSASYKREQLPDKYKEDLAEAARQIRMIPGKGG